MNKKIFAGLLFIFLLSFLKIDAQNYDQRDRDGARPVYPDRRDKRNDDIETRRIINDVEARLNNLEMSLPERMRPDDRQDIHRQIADIINVLNNLNPREEIRRPAPMPEMEFNDFIIAITKEPFAKGKQQIIIGSADRNFFTLDQVIRILTQFSFDEEKLDVVKILYPRVLNRDRNYRLYDSFTFSTTKQKLGDYLNSFPKDENQN